MNIKKLFVGLAVVAMVCVAGTAGAQTLTADQIMQALLANPTLLAQLSGLLGGQAPAANVTAAPKAPLTIGSKGAEVTALQTWLISQGYAIPAGATGYFGGQTQAAVKAFQIANNITPAAGYYGNLTAAAVASKMTTTVPPGTTLPAGCTSTAGYSSTTGQKCDGTTSGGGVITTPGAEGILTVTTNATPGAGLTIREGDAKTNVLGLKLEAKLSDIAIQRVKVDLGSSTVVYNKLFDKIYVMDGSTVVAESALNSSTVVKDGTTYYITLTGFNVIVPKGGSKVLTLALEPKTSIDSTYDNNATYGLAIPIDGVRGVDGAGLTQSGPATALTRRTVTIDADALVDAATLAVSYNSSSMAAQEVVADQGTTNDEYDALPLMAFNLKAEKDDVIVTDLVASITRGGDTSTATATTAYLYDGDTVVGSATVEGTSLTAMTATFSDIDFTVPKDTTKTLTLKVDIRDAGTTVTTFKGTISSGANVTAENNLGTAISESGTATGNTLSLLSSGLKIELVGTPSLITAGAPQSSTANTYSTSTMTATFNVKVTAMGADIDLARLASSTPMFAKTGATNSFTVYKDDVALTTEVATTTNYTIPSTCSTGSLTNGCTLAEGSSVTIPVTYTIPGRTAASVALTAGNYAVQMIKVNWGSTVKASTFMADLTEWRTNAVAFP